MIVREVLPNPNLYGEPFKPQGYSYRGMSCPGASVGSCGSCSSMGCPSRQAEPNPWLGTLGLLVGIALIWFIARTDDSLYDGPIEVVERIPDTKLS